MTPGISQLSREFNTTLPPSEYPTNEPPAALLSELMQHRQ